MAPFCASRHAEYISARRATDWPAARAVVDVAFVGANLARAVRSRLRLDPRVVTTGGELVSRASRSRAARVRSSDDLAGEFGAGGQRQLREDVPEVGLHCAWRHEQPLGDLRVGEPLGDERGDWRSLRVRLSHPAAGRWRSPRRRGVRRGDAVPPRRAPPCARPRAARSERGLARVVRAPPQRVRRARASRLPPRAPMRARAAAGNLNQRRRRRAGWRAHLRPRPGSAGRQSRPRRRARGRLTLRSPRLPPPPAPGRRRRARGVPGLARGRVARRRTLRR
jgi:hypothetical protein